MMKSVLISIRPQWAEKIAKGEKTIEVRKTRPKCDVPFKCYIYCTKEKLINNVFLIYGGGKYACFGDYRNACTSDADGKVDCYIGNGKIIGEFVCNRITELESEFWDDDTYESIGEVWYDEDDGERNVIIFVDNCCDNYKANILCRKSCATLEELRRYIGTGINTFYAWHISDLKIYDKPRELSEFSRPCSYSGLCFSCKRTSFKKDGNLLCNTKITRPPQSWCYVEDLGEEE